MQKRRLAHRFFTPRWLAEGFAAVFRAAGYSAKENYPYSVCLVPNAVMQGRVDCECVSVMVEVNKRVYCGGETGVERLRIIIENLMK